MPCSAHACELSPVAHLPHYPAHDLPTLRIHSTGSPVFPLTWLASACPVSTCNCNAMTTCLFVSSHADA
jgi:hypothetical protein